MVSVTPKPSIPSNRICQRFLKQGYQETVNWYAEQRSVNPERASYEVSLKILENSGNNVREAVDGEVCRGLWQKYMSDADVASIAREALSLPTPQRQDAIFWRLVPYHIPSRDSFLIMDAFYIVFPEIRKTAPWKELDWVEERLHLPTGILSDGSGEAAIHVAATTDSRRAKGKGASASAEGVETSNAPASTGLLTTFGFGVTAFLCCVSACLICNGWDTLKMDSPDSLFTRPTLKWVVSVVTVILVWGIEMASAADFWVDKIRRQPLSIFLMIPMLLGGSIVAGYIANIAAALIVMLIGLVWLLVVAVFTIFT